ncbi:MAG: hypothetical protein RRY35_03320, partial [Clostridiales bacterium]
CVFGPAISGFVFNKSDSYNLVWILFVLISILMFVCIIFAVAGARKLMKTEAAKLSPAANEGQPKAE